jgi:hypothetical protein
MVSDIPKVMNGNIFGVHVVVLECKGGRFVQAIGSDQ